MKILYVTTTSKTMIFFTSHINMLLDQGHTVDMVCNMDFPINSKLLERGCKAFNLEFQRSPLKKENYSAIKALRTLVIKNGYDIVHTHTPVASACTRLSCRKIKKTKIFYTAHGFHFYKGAPLLNWLVYYPIERYLSRYTDTLITINQEDYERAKFKFKAKRVEYIPGVGLNTEKFKNLVVDRKAKREELGLPENSFVVLSVGELNRNKNHEVVIRAIEKINNPNIHYVICGEGPLEAYLKKLIESLDIEKQIHLLGYRNDIAEICNASDIFAFPSKREGLGLAALEAMACGLPLITSNVHGINDYSIDGITGYARNPMDLDGFAHAIRVLTESKDQLQRMNEYNLSAVNKYAIDSILKEMMKIYNIGGNIDGTISINNNTDI